jgi:hypothetical protein
MQRSARARAPLALAQATPPVAPRVAADRPLSPLPGWRPGLASTSASSPKGLRGHHHPPPPLRARRPRAAVWSLLGRRDGFSGHS